MDSIKLYDIKEGNNWFSMNAAIRNGKLEMIGTDFCKLAEDMFGGEEVEHIYNFDMENTEKLRKFLAEEDLIEGLNKFFDNQMREAEFIKFCKENEIKYRYICWHE